MGKVESLEDEHKAMRHELAVRRYLDELGSLTPNAKRARVASLAEELQDMKRRKYLSRQEKNHIRVLEDVIDVLSESR
jgi:uncharacterized protein YkwD